jgi:excisionase family DNA binding protein
MNIPFTTKEAAKFIGCSEYTLRKFAREKKIPCYRVGKLLLFRETSLIKWMEKQEQQNYIN